MKRLITILAFLLAADGLWSHDWRMIFAGVATALIWPLVAVDLEDARHEAALDALSGTTRRELEASLRPVPCSRLDVGSCWLLVGVGGCRLAGVEAHMTCTCRKGARCWACMDRDGLTKPTATRRQSAEKRIFDLWYSKALLGSRLHYWTELAASRRRNAEAVQSTASAE